MTHANFAQEKLIPILRQSQQDLTLLIWMKMVLITFFLRSLTIYLCETKEMYM